MVVLVGGSRRRLSVDAGLVIVETGHRRRQVVVVHLALPVTERAEERVCVLGSRGGHGRAAAGDGLISSSVETSSPLEERVDGRSDVSGRIPSDGAADYVAVGRSVDAVEVIA